MSKASGVEGSFPTSAKNGGCGAPEVSDTSYQRAGARAG